MQSLKKTTWGIWWIFAEPLKNLKTYFQFDFFVQSMESLSHKNKEELSFITLISDAKFE